MRKQFVRSKRPSRSFDAFPVQTYAIDGRRCPHPAKSAPPHPAVIQWGIGGLSSQAAMLAHVSRAFFKGQVPIHCWNAYAAMLTLETSQGNHV